MATIKLLYGACGGGCGHSCKVCGGGGRNAWVCWRASLIGCVFVFNVEFIGGEDGIGTLIIGFGVGLL